MKLIDPNDDPVPSPTYKCMLDFVYEICLHQQCIYCEHRTEFWMKRFLRWALRR